MPAYCRCSPQLLRVFVASVVQVLLWSGISTGQVEGRELGEQGRRAIEAEKRARHSIKLNHPGWTDSQVQTLIDRVQADFYQTPKAHLQAPPLEGAVVDLGLSAESTEESSEKPTRRPPSRALAGVRELLNSESASGWGYLGYDWVPEKSRLEEFRIGGLAGAPSEKIGKFLLVVLRSKGYIRQTLPQYIRPLNLTAQTLRPGFHDSGQARRFFGCPSEAA